MTMYSFHSNNGDKIGNKSFGVLFFLHLSFYLLGQFPPAAGAEGSTAIPADSELFVNWATHCKIERGWRNIVMQDSGKVSVGIPYNALGVADNEVISLGDGGVAILEFDFPIVNGEGADFAVFENSFDGFFLELAFVEVSSDGIHFFRFPATSHTDTAIQVGTFGLLDPTKINNLAGKYEVGYGTPFDLKELKNISGLNINAITHVRLLDVIGSVNETVASRDVFGNIINDPFPTPFDSGGFDLDAIGVIHESFDRTRIAIFPNPVLSGSAFSIRGIHKATSIRCYNVIGQEVAILKNGNQITILNDAVGVYFLALDISGSIFTVKFIVKNY